MNIVMLPNGYFPDPSLPKPVANGSIYIGIADLDPEIPANQKSISVLQEDGSEIAVSQPVSTSNGGVPTYNGSPVSVIVPDIPYSIKVLDSDDAQVYYIPSVSGTGGSTSSNTYTPNSDATDHGITGDSDTIKYYLETIGTTDKATIYLNHDSSNEWTDYNFLTTFDASAYNNVLFVLENGARFNPGAGVTVTLDSIYNLEVIHTQTIKTGSGTLSTTEGNITTSIYGLLGAELTQSNLVDSSDTGGILTQNDLLDEDDMVSDSDSLPATQQSIKSYADKKINGDGVNTAFLRSLKLTIEDGTNANTIKCTAASEFNGDADGPSDNLGKSTTVDSFTLDVSGNILKITSAYGNCLGVLSASMDRIEDITETLVVRGYVNANEITISFLDENGSSADLTAISISGSIQAHITYLTDA